MAPAVVPRRHGRLAEDHLSGSVANRHLIRISLARLPLIDRIDGERRRQRLAVELHLEHHLARVDLIHRQQQQVVEHALRRQGLFALVGHGVRPARRDDRRRLRQVERPVEVDDTIVRGDITGVGDPDAVILPSPV